MRADGIGRRPPALKHGLTSRLAREAMSEEVEALACELLASSPPEPQLMLAACEAADAILHLMRVQAARRSTLHAAARQKFEMPGTGLEIDWEGCLHGLLWDPKDPIGVLFAVKLTLHICDEGVRGRDGPTALAAVLADEPKELRQLHEYERRALSRRTKALRRLDYERIEAERRRKPT